MESSGGRPTWVQASAGPLLIGLTETSGYITSLARSHIPHCKMKIIIPSSSAWNEDNELKCVSLSFCHSSSEDKFHRNT